MKRIAPLVFLLVFVPMVVLSTEPSVYEVVVGDQLEMEGLAAANVSLSSLKLVASMDFATEKGAGLAADVELAWTFPPKWGSVSLTPGVVGGVKRNNEATAWKTGLFVRIEGPAFHSTVSPYLRLAATYQDPGGSEDGAFVASTGLGLSFLIGQKGCKKSAIEVEGSFQRASAAIYADDDDLRKHDEGVSIGIKIFF